MKELYLDKIERRKENAEILKNTEVLGSKNATNTTSGYASLHTHSRWSLLDGMANETGLAEYAKELGMNALAITDHGSMFGVVKFSKACKKAGIKPIIGCEVYTAERTMYDKEAVADKPIGHLVLLCKNETGYKNLIKIVSRAYTEGFYYKPRTDKEELRKYHEGLICLSGCLAGKTQKLIIQNKYNEAKKEALELLDIFGEGNFYLELQDHGQKEDTKAIDGLIKIHNETGIPLVATNDSHYIRKSDATAHELLLCMQTQSTLNNEKHLRFNDSQYYLKSEKEMRDLFYYIPEACDNTVKIAEECNFDFSYGHYNIPNFSVPDEYKDAEEYFRHLCNEGFKRRYPVETPELRERLEYEIATIINMGFVEYFLIVWDFINFAKTEGIPVGKGRGSAAGSIVAYCLAITDIDPIKYNLFFERFLNPERVSMPDIDVDFCIKRRGEVIDYVTKKYGQDSVCQISTFGTMKSKMAVKDVARVLEVPYVESNRLSKMIPDDMSLTEAINADPDLQREYNAMPQSQAVLDYAIQLENIPRHCSTHAAGVVIAPEPVSNFVPLVNTQKGIATQYTMTEIEELGLLKMDFLGLRNLTVIQDTLNQIKANYDKDVNLDNLDLNDPKIFEMIAKGKTVGVFQLESKGITDFMKKLKPSCFEDIIAGVALYRPGPMDSIPTYIKNKKHQDKIEYIDNHLAPILDVTYGCIVYQEQVMQIVQQLAGYSFARADLVRRAMSKKKADVMAEEREYFINGKLDKDGNIEIPGCIRNGIPKSAAEKIFDDMESFAQYAFNKSHATAYSVITYQTAWLKYYYPSEFMAALMTSEENNHDHLNVFIKEAKKMNTTEGSRRIKILPPNVNKSKADFISNSDGDILYGLAAVKGVGRAIAENLTDKQYTSVFDVLEIEKINSKAVEGLALTGAFKEFVPSAAAVIEGLDDAMKLVRRNKLKKNQISIFDELDSYEEFRPQLPNIEEYPKEQLLGFEKTYLGSYITGHPLRKYRQQIKEYATITPEIIENEEYDYFGILAGMITEVKIHYTKKGDKMAFVSVDDINDNTFDVVILPKKYNLYKSFLSEGNTVAIYGNVEAGSFLAEQLADITDIAFLASKNTNITYSDEDMELRFMCEKNKLPEIIKALNKYPGKYPIRWFDTNGKSRLMKQTVSQDQLLLLELQEIIGMNNVKYKRIV